MIIKGKKLWTSGGQEREYCSQVKSLTSKYKLKTIPLSIDDSSYRLIFYLDRASSKLAKSSFKVSKVWSRNVVKCIALQVSQILYIFVLRAEVCTTFEPIVVQTSARNTKIYKI